MERPIFLIGFMGSGKSTWGKKMATAMELPFADLDHIISSQIGISIPEYFKQFGEDQFRRIEQMTLHDQKSFPGIVSTGGGTPCFFDNMDWMLKHGTVLYLHHTAGSLYDRLSKSKIEKRPALKGLSGEELRQLIEHRLSERAPYYDRAHIIIDQINTSIEKLVATVHEYPHKSK